MGLHKLPNGATAPLEALSKTESRHMRKLIARVMNAFYRHPGLWGHRMQQGGSGAPTPRALEAPDKGRIHAAQGPGVAPPPARGAGTCSC